MPRSFDADADVVHCLHYADAAGAASGRAPVVLKLTGTVLPDRMTGLDARLLAVCPGAVGRGVGRTVPGPSSRCGASTYRCGSSRPVSTPSRFLPGARSERPLVVCAATGDEPRKRLRRPACRLAGGAAALPDAELVARRPPALDLPEGARSVGPQPRERLAELYASAWTVVAPAVYEALGLVTLEALASGTPVAGADSGATSELLADPRVGTLAEPTNPESLAEAIVRAAHLSQDPATAGHCRARSLPFDWSHVVPTVLEGYERVRLSHSRANRR